MTNSIERLSLLSSKHREIYFYILQSAQKGEATPSNQQLCDLVGYQKLDSAKYAIEKLEARDLISVFYRGKLRSIKFNGTRFQTEFTVRKNMKVASKHEKEVLKLLEETADKGLPCPSNSELAIHIDCLSLSTPTNVLHRLRDQGLIQIDSYMRFRRITITRTGQQTAAPRNSTQPHWRKRPNPPHHRNTLQHA